MIPAPYPATAGKTPITPRFTVVREVPMRRASSDWRGWGDPIVELWLADMGRRNLGALTIAKRRHNIARLAIDVGKPLAAITSVDIDAFLDGRHVSPHSRGHWISNLNTFYKWAVAHDLLTANPVARLTRPRLGRYLPNPIPESELDRALAAATPLMRGWLTLMAYAGLRVAEVAGLCGEDVDRDAGMLRIVGKGRKTRLVPIHPTVTDCLASAPPVGPVYVRAEDGRPYTPAEISLAVGRHLRACHCTRVTAHKLRHRFATVLLEAGVDIAVVAEMLGHESIETTRGYGAVSTRRMRAAMDLI